MTSGYHIKLINFSTTLDKVLLEKPLITLSSSFYSPISSMIYCLSNLKAHFYPPTRFMTIHYPWNFFTAPFPDNYLKVLNYSLKRIEITVFQVFERFFPFPGASLSCSNYSFLIFSYDFNYHLIFYPQSYIMFQLLQLSIKAC